MGIMDYFKGKKQLKTKEVTTENKTVFNFRTMKKVQNFLTKTKRLELGQEPGFNNDTIKLISKYYELHRASLETQQTVKDEMFTTDMYDLFNYYKDLYQTTFNNHCNEYVKIKKLKGLTAEQREKIDSAFVDLKTVYLQNLKKIPALATSEKGAEKK